MAKSPALSAGVKLLMRGKLQSNSQSRVTLSSYWALSSWIEISRKINLNYQGLLLEVKMGLLGFTPFTLMLLAS
jgi:hypothetical protein